MNAVGASSFEPLVVGARCFLLRNASLASRARVAMGLIPRTRSGPYQEDRRKSAGPWLRERKPLIAYTIQAKDTRGNRRRTQSTLAYWGFSASTPRLVAKEIRTVGRLYRHPLDYFPSAARKRLARARSNFQAMPLFLSISGRNSQKVNP